MRSTMMKLWMFGAVALGLLVGCGDDETKNPPLLSIGPRVHKSPFFDATLRYGATAFTVYNHTFLPASCAPVTTSVPVTASSGISYSFR